MAYRASSTSGVVYTATPTGTLPTGTITGDIVIAELSGSILSSTLPVTPPAGWTAIVSQSFGGNSHAQAWWAPGSIAAFGWALAGSNDCAIRLHSFSGRNTTAPITASIAITDSTGAIALPAGSVTAVVGDDILVVWLDPQTNGAFGALPSSYTSAGDDAAAAPMRTAAAYRNNVSAGATGILSRNTGGTGYENRIALTIAVAAASGGGGTLGQFDPELRIAAWF